MSELSFQQGRSQTKILRAGGKSDKGKKSVKVGAHNRKQTSDVKMNVASAEKFGLF